MRAGLGMVGYGGHRLDWEESFLYIYQNVHNIKHKGNSNFWKAYVLVKDYALKLAIQ